jgi:8-oxo-dGTP pyrophosphatase MutT (NUDIX family)
VQETNRLIDIQNARVNTAGAYVCIDGSYLFALGIRPHNGQIPLVRLGGHREDNETGWQCAAREVLEEANLYITPLLPQKTYAVDWDHLDGGPEEIPWQQEPKEEPVPLLIVVHRHGKETSLSLMYLVQAEGNPTPSSEVKGLILLSSEEIHHLCRESISLKQFLHRGGRAILSDGFDTKLVLEPFAQLRLLSRILYL